MLVAKREMKQSDETDILMNGNTAPHPALTLAEGTGEYQKREVPSLENKRLYRDALGKFATGVTVVTARTDKGPVGMTANSFASVSLDPALVLWSVDKSSGRYEVFRDAKHFAIHILREDQSELALDFAKNADAFSNCEWRDNEHGVPLLRHSLTRFECDLETTHDGGDHTIIIGRVTGFSKQDGNSLIFASGKFGAFSAVK
jgi:flavin reductase (DIM6/NTAB) family NADH-FMN oxidoreductase RutF